MFWWEKNMVEESSPIAEVQELIERICVEVGPRPAGSEEEMRAQELIADCVEKSGYQSHWESFQFPNTGLYFPYLAILGFWMFLGGIIPRVGIVLLIISPFITAGLPAIYDWLINLLHETKSSRNLFLVPNGLTKEELDILLVAHIDTAVILPTIKGALHWISDHLMELLEVLTWFLSICSIAILVGTIKSVFFSEVIHSLALTMGVILIGLDLWQQLASRNRYTIGANDNTSGVAICSVLLNHLPEILPKPPRVGFLVTGAEEAGLHGARWAVNSMRTLDSKPIIINVDMAGNGLHLGTVNRAGRLRPRACDVTLIDHLKKFSPGLVKIDYKYRAGDFLPFIQNGYRAVSLEATNYGQVPSTYHSGNDDPDHIDPIALERIYTTLVYLIQTYPEYRLEN